MFIFVFAFFRLSRHAEFFVSASQVAFELNGQQHSKSYAESKIERKYIYIPSAIRIIIDSNEIIDFVRRAPCSMDTMNLRFFPQTTKHLIWAIWSVFDKRLADGTRSTIVFRKERKK